MRHLLYIFLFSIGVIACQKDPELTTNDPSEEFPGGATTFNIVFSGVFEQAANNLSGAELLQHQHGDASFESNFVTSPALINPGLGPVFNQLACASCHPKNGRSIQPFSGADLKGLLFRISIPGTGAHGGPAEVPGFGTQLQTKATFGKNPEGEVQITFTETNYTFDDGMPYSLRKPTYTVTSNYATFPGNMLVSPRIAQPVIGLGLLEAINESDIISKEDINDLDGNGISGKANRVWNPITQQTDLGRFGWKAGNANLVLQAASALHEDMGVTSWIFPLETAAGQPQDDFLNDDAEVDSQFVADISFYTKSLAIPKRRNFNDANVLRGKQLFFKIGCDNCHRQKYITGTTSDAFLNNQTIYPYTDLLLHDMGPELADNRPDFLATGQEWRTPPLWGIGLTSLINNHTNFLHDGRARNILEAILWHGGEAENQKIMVKKLSKKERDDLVSFINSL